MPYLITENLQLETIRLYPPIMALPKWTNQYPQDLKIGTETLSIPANTAVLTSLLAIQTHPTYWKPDPLKWLPSRWIRPSLSSNSSPSNTNLAAKLQSEDIVVPLKGTYFPWSDGPQNCPGKKFAQVEFVAVLACLFRDHRVHVVLKDGEDFQKAQERVLAVAEDCEQGLLLRMRDADSIRLAWEKV